jgi:hypothetical protein
MEVPPLQAKKSYNQALEGVAGKVPRFHAYRNFLAPISNRDLIGEGGRGGFGVGALTGGFFEILSVAKPRLVIRRAIIIKWIRK